MEERQWGRGMLPKMEGGEHPLPLPTFNTMLEDDHNNDWYLNNPSLTSLLSSSSTFDLYDHSVPFLPISTADDPFALQPLEASPPAGAEPTLFQKRAAGRKEEAADVKEEGDVDGNAGGEVRGKKRGKGMPAKNLMAERRRRQKLNDRLFMLRSVVPKISKMDRASILGDAIDYMKELRQKINDLNNELGSTPSNSSLPLSNPTSFQPLTPTLPTLPSCMIDELSPSSLPSANTQSTEVEVTVTDDQAVNIHMVCPRRPSVLLSSLGALDGLGLDIQQAVVSCFSGFRLDVFRAEQCRAGPAARPEEIRAALLQAAGFHGI